MSIDYSILAENLRFVTSRQPDAAEYFCALLFRQCPRAERLFPLDVPPAEFARALERILSDANAGAAIADTFRAIGQRHRDRGDDVRDACRVAADALISVLILVSADAWTPTLHSLWRSACSQFVAWVSDGLAGPAIEDVTSSATPPTFADLLASESPYLLVLVGPSRGEVIPVGRTVTIGSGDEVDVHIHDVTVSREHARIVRGTLALHLTDLQSTAGTRLNGVPVSRPTILSDGDQIALGGTTLLLFSYREGLEQLFRRGLFQRATHDQLTQVFTREYFSERLAAEVAFARRHNSPLAILLLQQHSLSLGGPSSPSRSALRKVARRIKTALRAEDLVAKYDDQRFAVLCRDLHDQQALLLARRLRQLIASPSSYVVASAASQGGRSETVSIGISSFIRSPSGDLHDNFLFSAEVALYRAIHLGPGRIVVAGEIDPS